MGSLQLRWRGVDFCTSLHPFSLGIPCFVALDTPTKRNKEVLKEQVRSRYRCRAPRYHANTRIQYVQSTVSLTGPYRIFTNEIRVFKWRLFQSVAIEKPQCPANTLSTFSRPHPTHLEVLTFHKEQTRKPKHSKSAHWLSKTLTGAQPRQRRGGPARARRACRKQRRSSGPSLQNTSGIGVGGGWGEGGWGCGGGWGIGNGGVV